MSTDFARLEITAWQLDRLCRHLQARPLLPVELDGMTAFMLIGQLQLALRHPQNRGASAGVARRVADGLIERLAGGDEEIRTLLRHGYDPAYDVPPAPAPND